jgi:hypothetical protein
MRWGPEGERDQKGMMEKRWRLTGDVCRPCNRKVPSYETLVDDSESKVLMRQICRENE